MSFLLYSHIVEHKLITFLAVNSSLIHNLSPPKKSPASTDFYESSENVDAKYESCPAQCPADVLIS